MVLSLSVYRKDKVMQRIVRSLKYRFFKLFKREEGQITFTSEIGRWIYLLSSLESVKVIVEIGVWNGKGSSNIVCRGIESNLNKYRDTMAFGLEISLDQYRIANRALRRYPFYKLIHGKIVEEYQLDHSGLNFNEEKWIIEDIKNMKSCPNVIEILPNFIDLLLLDGGEFSTYSEFKALEDRLIGWVLLDDTNTRKCKKLFLELSESDSYNLIYSSDERNGVAVFRKAN